MVAFSADLDALTALAGRMDGIVRTLDDLGAHPPDVAALGRGDAAGALHDFVTGWSHGRSEIVAGLTDAAAGIRGATGNYTNAEQQLSSQWSAATPAG